LNCSKGARGCGAKDIRSQNATKCFNKSDLLQLLHNPRVLLTFGKVQNPLHLPQGMTLKHRKVERKDRFG
jgi:hypothetical protein